MSIAEKTYTSGQVPVQESPRPHKAPRKPSLKFTAGVLVGVILTVIVLGIGKLFSFPARPQPVSESTPAAPSPGAASLNLQNRILYDADDYYFSQPQAVPKLQLTTMEKDGSNPREHPLVCGSEAVAVEEIISNIAHSPDGKTLAFVLPTKEQKSQQPNWREERSLGKRPFSQGQLHLFDLEMNGCTATGITVDRLYQQNLAFSPDGKYLAYVFYGLRLYGMVTKQSQTLTQMEGSAKYPKLITGPLVWNGTSTAVYMAVSDTSGSLDTLPTELVKVTLPDGRRQTVLKLPDLHLEQPAGEEVFQLAHLPDNSSIYAVSPNETRIAVESSGDLVVKNLADPAQPTKPVYKKSDYSPGEPSGHVLKVVWLPNGWLIFETDQSATGSGIGDVWASLHGEPGQRLVHGNSFSVDVTGYFIVYNFDYFGEYYLPPGEPHPSGFAVTGHKYDGLGVYNLINKTDRKLSGNGKPKGEVLTWFW